MSDWGDRIKSRRIELGISQVDLADACGIKPPSVNNWESGTTKMIDGHNLVAAAKKLQTSPDWIMNGKGAAGASAASGSASQSQRLDPEIVRGTHRFIRETLADSDEVFDIEAEPALFVMAYERFEKITGQPTVGALVSIGRDIERFRQGGVGNGEQGADGRTGVANAAPGKRRIAR